MFSIPSKHTAGQLATVQKKFPPRAHEVSLKVVDSQSDKVTIMTLSQALQRLEPLSYLAVAGPGAYSIQSFPHPGPVEPNKSIRRKYNPFARAGGGKEFHLTTSCTPPALRNYLRLSYKYVLEGFVWNSIFTRDRRIRRRVLVLRSTGPLQIACTLGRIQYYRQCLRGQQCWRNLLPLIYLSRRRSPRTSRRQRLR